MRCKWLLPICAPILALGALSCEGKSEAAGDNHSANGGGGDRRGGESRGERRGGRGGFPGFGDFGQAAATAIPVDVANVERRDIADYLETNGTLEAENEVDVVARISGPIVELLVEEGDRVEKGQLLAKIDAAEIQAQLGIARVTLEEARLALERAREASSPSMLAVHAGRYSFFQSLRSQYEEAARSAALW